MASFWSMKKMDPSNIKEFTFQEWIAKDSHGTQAGGKEAWVPQNGQL
jgi:hypothetical protein